MSSQSGQRVEDVYGKGALAVLIAFWREVVALRRGGWGNLWGYVFIAPAVILFAIFQMYPLVRGFLMAFSNYRWLIPETQGLFDLNGLANYREMLHDPIFYRSFGVSLRYTLLFLPTMVIVSLFIAILISRVKSTLMASFYRIVIYMPVVLPVSVAMIMWKQLYNPEYGQLNYLLRTVFQVKNPPNWLGSPDWAIYATVIADIWCRFGYYTLLFLIGIYNIDPTLYEAAAIDGAGDWSKLRYITLPLLKPTIVLVLVLVIGVSPINGGEITSILNLFSSTSPSGPGESVLTLGLYAYRTAFVIGDKRMGYAAAISLVLGVLSALLSGLVVRWLRTERA